MEYRRTRHLRPLGGDGPPGVAQERADALGALTIWEDHFFAEAIDPLSGAPLPDGELGELVLTSLTKEATPVVRYRTGDLTRRFEPLPPFPYRRMERVLGRCDDMLIIRGVNLFPGQIEELILESPKLAPHYQIHIQRDGTMDHLTVVVEERAPVVAVSDIDSAGSHLAMRIKSRLGITAEVVVREPGSIARSEGKAKRVFDQRRSS